MAMENASATTSNKLVTGIAVVLAIAVVALFFYVMNTEQTGAPLGDNGTENAAGDALASALSAFDTAEVSQTTGLITEDVTPGAGAEATAGDTVTVEYVGALPGGSVFDTSRGREPFTFTLGGGQVIQGWEQGIVGMKEGGTRVLVIPPSLGYGDLDLGVIPPNSVLLFEVELLKVEKR